ncbi:MAG: putative Ig domain-containing protein [Bryobacteraceae bacterium]
MAAFPSLAQVTVTCKPATLPQLVGTAVSVSCSASGGTSPYSWSISAGALPPGLTLDPAGVTIAGTLADPAGPYTFTVTATDSSLPPNTGSQVYSGTTLDALATTCTLATGPAEVGVLYTNACSASGGTPPYTWSIVGISPPPGLTVSSTGGISYTPATVMASYSYRVLATDSSTPAMQAFQAFTGAIAPAVAITTTSPLPPAQVSVSYSDTLTASGGVPPYTWTATSLPAGLTIAPTTNVISGKATTPGTASVNLSVTDAAGGVSAGTFSLTVNPTLTITTTSPLTPSATVGVAYTDTFVATGGSGGYTWSATGLPSWLTLSSAGVLTGTATSPGTASFNVTVTDSSNETTTGAFTLVASYPKLTITTSSPLANGTAGAAYNQTLTGTGGFGAYAWSLSSGSLPVGLTLISSPTTASISGTPSATGTSTFIVGLADGATPPDTTTKSFSITISAGLTITTTSLPNATVGIAYTQSLAAAGGVAPYTWSITAGALPSAFTLNATSGAITGTAAAAGSASFTATVTDSTGTTANQPLTLTIVVAPVITTASPLPNGSTGVAYSQTLAATGGTTPYKWTVSTGALPTGLSLTTAGVINGTPTVPGTDTFAVQLTDATGVTATKSLSLTIISTLTISTTSPLPTGEAGVAYAQTLAVTGGTPPYTWSITGGTLPSGLTLTAAGAVSGTPTANGAFGFTVQVTDSNKVTASATFSLNILQAVQISTPSALPGGALAAAYSQSLTASAGEAPYTWSVTSGALPPGLTFSSGGAITGTPTKTGTFTFTGNVSDALGGATNRQFTIVIAAGLTITTPALPVATVGVPYSQTLGATGGTAPYTWALTAGSLPPGLSLTDGGSVTGNPTVAGTSTFSVQVTDSLGRQASAPFSITVAPSLSITTTSLPGGSPGAAYSQTLAATGGTPPYTWSIVNGALPGGLSLSSSGAITGSLSAAGTFTFTVQVSDSASAIATKKLSITVVSGLSITTAATLPGAPLNASYSQTLSAAGGAPPYTWALTGGALPAGITLSAAGVVSGTATASGTFTFTATVTDSAAATASQQFTLVVSGLSFSTTSLPNGTIGTAYDQTLVATGGTPPYTYAKTAGTLPPGIALSGSTLSGTPTAAGSFTFTIQVTDFTSATATQQLTIVIGGLAITTAATLPSAALGTAYSQTVAATGTAPYTWAVTAGALPGGLTLDASSGTISGTPNAAGDFSFTLQVTDSTKATASQAFMLTVLAATFSGISDTATSAQQLSGTLALGANYQEAVTAQVTLSFTPDATLTWPAPDPAIQFSSGGTTASFTMPANTTAPVSFALQTGTVAGTITLTVSLQAGSGAAVPAVVTQTIQIAPAMPVISAVSVSTSSSSFTVSVTAYSNTRDASQATLQFTPASGQTLENSSVTVPLTSAASNWFQSSSSDQYGSQFILTLPFTLTNGSASGLASVSVTLTNSAGVSTATSANF